MLPKDFVILIEKDLVDRIVIGRSSPTTAWSVSVHGHSLPAGLAPQIELNPEGCTRLWADLDAAYGFVRKSGFPHLIVIEG